MHFCKYGLKQGMSKVLMVAFYSTLISLCTCLSSGICWGGSHCLFPSPPMPFLLDLYPINNGNKGTHSHRVYFHSQATCIKQHQPISTTYLTEKFLVTFSDGRCRGTGDNGTCCCDSCNSWNFVGRKWLYHWRGTAKKPNKTKKRKRKKKKSNFIHFDK